MRDSTGTPSEQHGIQRAEDVRPAPRSPELHEAIRRPGAALPAQADARIAPPADAPAAGGGPATVNRELVGQSIRERQGFGFGPALWTLVAVGIVAIAALTGNPHPALVAVAPLAIAVSSLAWRRRPFSCRLGEDALECDSPTLTLPFVAIEELISAGAGKKDAFAICYADGYVMVPQTLTVAWQAFRQFLVDQLQPQRFMPRMSGRLRKYYDRNVALFGARHMHVFCARDRLTPTRPPSRVGLAYTSGLLAAAIIWFAAGLMGGRPYEPWIGVGLGFGFLSGLLFLLFGLIHYQRTPRIKNWRDACLVMGPAGLALEQGELVGELRWEEVTKVSDQSRFLFFAHASNHALPCIRLEVLGATIRILDLYHRPLYHLHYLVDSFWRDARR